MGKILSQPLGVHSQETMPILTTQYSFILSLTHSLIDHTVEHFMFLALSRALDGEVLLSKTLKKILMLLWGFWEEEVLLAEG